jgi:hypothetical protein
MKKISERCRFYFTPLNDVKGDAPLRIWQCRCVSLEISDECICFISYHIMAVSRAPYALK